MLSYGKIFQLFLNLLFEKSNFKSCDFDLFNMFTIYK